MRHQPLRTDLRSETGSIIILTAFMLIVLMGFTGLAVLWLGCTGFALRAILQRRMQDHRDWMIRSYALTFAAVTLRLWLPLLTQASGVEFTEAYVTVSWLAWVPNLLIAEIAIQRRHASPRSRVAKVTQASQL